MCGELTSVSVSLGLPEKVESTARKKSKLEMKNLRGIPMSKLQ